MLKKLHEPHIFVAEREGVWTAHAFARPIAFTGERTKIFVHWDRMPAVCDTKRWREASFESVYTLGNMITMSLGEWTPDISWTMAPATSEGFHEVWIEFIRRNNADTREPAPCGV